jgi:uncharacterized membrane protein YccC
VSAHRTEHVIRLSEHPRAARQIRAAKGWGGLVAFLAVGLLSHRAGVPDFEVGVRALVAGIAGYFIAWAIAVQVWRYLAIAELRSAQERALERREKALEARRAQRAAREREGGGGAGRQPSPASAPLTNDAGAAAPGREAARL